MNPTELMVIIEGPPASGKRKMLAAIAKMLPCARVLKDVRTQGILDGRGLLTHCSSCCFDRVQGKFVRRRLRNEMDTSRRPGVTIRIRDVFSCRSYEQAYKTCVFDAWRGRLEESPLISVPPCVTEISGEQTAAELCAASQFENQRRLRIILLTPEDSSTERFLQQHDAWRREELKPLARTFVKQLLFHQLLELDTKDYKLVMHSPENPHATAKAIIEIIKRECTKINISLDNQNLSSTAAEDDTGAG